MLKRKPKTENEKTEEYFQREVFPMIKRIRKGVQRTRKTENNGERNIFK